MTLIYIWLAIVTALVIGELAGGYFAGSKDEDRERKWQERILEIKEDIKDLDKYVNERLSEHVDKLQEAHRLIADASFRLDEIEDQAEERFPDKIYRLHDDVYSKGGLTFLRDSARRVKKLEARIFDIENKPDSDINMYKMLEPENREDYGYGIVLANVGVPFDKCRVWSTKKGAERFIERSGGVYGSLEIVPLSFESDA